MTGKRNQEVLPAFDTKSFGLPSERIIRVVRSEISGRKRFPIHFDRQRGGEAMVT
jgi:hypothetical protein